MHECRTLRVRDEQNRDKGFARTGREAHYATFTVGVPCVYRLGLVGVGGHRFLMCEGFDCKLPRCVLIRDVVCAQLRNDMPVAVGGCTEGEGAFIPENVWQLCLECLWDIL